MADNTNWDGWVTPDLARNPGLAADAYNSKQPELFAPVLSYANKGIAVQDAINDHAEGNGTQTFWEKFGSKTINGLSWLGKPLKEIQRSYKFTHSVYTDHGFLEGFAVTLGVIGGGVGGFFLAGPQGAILGADAAAIGLRKLSTVGPWEQTYKDSYTKSEDENYRVSPGRDFSNAVSQAAKIVGAEGVAKQFATTNKSSGKVGPVEFKLGSKGSIASGSIDLAFDLTTDPIMVLGRFAQLMKTGKLVGLDKVGKIEMTYPIMETVPGVKNFIISRTRKPLTPNQLDELRTGSGVTVKGTDVLNAGSRIYARALEDIAQSTAGEIARKYPELGTVAAGRLGAIKTADGVHDFFKTSLYFGELEGTLAGQAMLPTRTLLRATLGDTKVVDVLRNAAVSRYIVDATGNRILNPKYNPLSVKQRASTVYKTFSGYMPYSVDPNTQKLSLTKFKWNAPDASLNIYYMGRVGMGDKAAKEMAGKYAEAVAVNDLALARDIKNQTIFDTFKALGLPDDNAFVTKVYNDINKISQPLVGTQVYGTDALGNALGQYTANGVNKIGGLVSHQAQDVFDFPDFFAIKKAMRDAGQYSKFVGKLDEFVANAYTNKIFKPLALATMGFGLRVAAAEMIPTFARYGVINTFKAKLAASAAKANYDLAPKEASNVFSAAMVGLGAHMGIAPDVMRAGFPAFQEAKRRGLNLAAKMLPEEQIDLATRLILANDGHLLSEAVQTGHGYDASTSYQMNQSAHYYYQIQKNSPMFSDLPEWTTYTADNIHYPVRLAANLNKAAKEPAYKNIAQDIVNEVKATSNNIKKQGELAKVNPKIATEDFFTTQEFQDFRATLVNKEYVRMLAAVQGKYKGYNEEMKTLTRWLDAVSSGDLRTFAQDRVDATLGMVMGKDGTYLETFADNIAKGQSVDFEELVKMNRQNQRSMPAAVAGPMLQPYVPSKNPLVYITNLGFKKVIDPIVNGLAREPLYVMHVAEAYSRMTPRITSGMLTEDQALRIAQTQASLGMLPQIHNTALRNQFSQIARNFLPFYFAQEQALKRAFRTLKDTSIASPVFSRGMRFYQLAEHTLSEPGFVQQDENGNKYMYLPGVGAFGEAVQGALGAYFMPMVPGLPITGKGSLVSLKSVLPELQMPGVSPVFAIAANRIANWFPSTSDIIQGTIGDISYQRGVVDTLVPATWAKTALAALSPVDLTGQLGNATLTAMSAAYFYNQLPPENASDPEKEEFIDRIKNNARSILLIKTFLNLTSPLAPQVSQEDAGFRDEFWKLVKQKGNFPDALMEFMGTHGSRATSYTVAKTESNVAGAKYPYIQETVDFINANHDKFFPKNYNGKDSVAQGMYFLIPQNNIKNESDLNVYNELMRQHLRSRRTPQEFLKQLYISQGDALMSSKIKEHVANLEKYSFDPYLKRQETQRWAGVMETMKNFHPTWYSNYTSSERRTQAQNSYNQLVKIFSDPNPPQHEQAKLVKGLMDEYQKHKSLMSQYKMLSLQGIVSQSEQQNWDDRLTILSVKEPRLKSVIDSVFKKLD